MNIPAMGRRAALTTLGFGLAIAAGASSVGANAMETLPTGAKSLEELHAALAKAPRRRDFKTVPMILDNPDLWDDEALKLVFGYQAARPKQACDNVDIAGPWLNVMRNSLNAQVFAFKHPELPRRLGDPRPRISHCSTRRCGTSTSSPSSPATSSSDNTLIVGAARRLRRPQGLPESRRRLFRRTTFHSRPAAARRRCSSAATTRCGK